MIVSVLQYISLKYWPRDCIGVLVFGISMPYEFDKLYTESKDETEDLEFSI